MPKEFEWPDGITGDRRYVIATIIWIIHDNAPILSEAGRATSMLLSLVNDAGIDISGGWLSKTLNDLSRHGEIGHFIDRDMNARRTFAIKCVRDPETFPFPPDPRRPRGGTKTPIEEPEEEVIEELDPSLFDDEMAGDESHDGKDEEVEDIIEGLREIVTVPGVAIEAVPEVSKADKILYIVSLLNEILTDELTAPQRSFEAQLGQQLTAVNSLIEENRKLKQEKEELRADKRKLAQALEQANTIMRDLSRRSANGQREELATTS
jgi:hypothetical protein